VLLVPLILIVWRLPDIRLRVIPFFMHMQKREWAQEAVTKLQAGQAVHVRPTGSSMHGKVSNGDLVTLEPCHPQDIDAGDVVLARVKGRRHFHLVLHLVMERRPDAFIIGNNHGRIDGWVTADNIFGKVTQVQMSTDEAAATA
jgi:SOS-response transcriptional repressor LexA